MYQPKPPPFNADVSTLARYVGDEFQAVASAGEDTVNFVQFNILYASPEKLRAGMVVYADGTTWNPGSGQGLYRRNVANSAWAFLG